VSHAALVAVVIALAGAAPPSARLVFNRGAGAESCPSEAEMRAVVARRLGFDPFDDDAPKQIHCALERSGGLFRAHIKVATASAAPAAERRLVSPRKDCAELAAAVELALSVAINPASAGQPADVEPPRARAAPVEPKPAPAAGPPVEAPPAPPPPPARVTPAPAITRSPPPFDRAPAAPRSYTLLARADAGVGFGLGPGATLATGAGVAVVWRALSVDVGGRWVAPSSAAVSGGSVTTWSWSLSIAPCAHREWLAACAVAAAGALHARGDGLALTATDVGLYAAAGARGLVDAPIGARWRLRVAGELVTPLVRAHLVVEGREQWAPPRLQVVAGLGLVRSFW